LSTTAVAERVSYLPVRRERYE